MKTSLKFGIVAGIAVLITACSAETQAQSLRDKWQLDDVGLASFPGECVTSETNITLRSSGAGFGENSESFAYVHQSWAGDGQFVARLACMVGPHDSGIAGLMIRDGVSTNGSFFMAGLTVDGNTVLKTRAKAGEETKTIAFSMVSLQRQAGLQFTATNTAKTVLSSAIVPGRLWLGTNCWLKMQRRGAVYSAFGSIDGSVWYWLGTETIPTVNPQVGLVAAGLESSASTSATFEALNLDLSSACVAAKLTAGNGDGLLGLYESKVNGNKMQRIDPVIDFQWGLGGPDPKIGIDLFYVKWEGMLEAQYSETYAITVASDERVRLWIDDRLLIDKWHWYSTEETTAEISLVAGQKYSVRLEYAETWGQATVQLFWSSPSTPRQIIPQSQLFSRLEEGAFTDSDNDGIPDRWERTYGLNPNDPSDAAQDSDDLGVPNYKRYLAGIDPRELARQAGAAKKMNGAWRSRDIGVVVRLGAINSSGDQFLVGGSGDDSSLCRDNFQFTYVPCQGDVQIVARIDSLSEGSDFLAKAGLMVREDLTDRSKNTWFARMPYSGLRIQHRAEFASRTTYRAWYEKLYPWVKLVRRGNAFEAYASVDGVAWTWLNTETVVMDKNVYVGLAVNSHDNSKSCSAQFTHVTIGAPDSPKTPNAATALGDGLQATYRDLETGLTVERIDPNIDFDWNLDVPAPGIDPHHFAMQWEGLLEAPHSETYDIRVASGSSFRLTIDGKVVMDWSSLPEKSPADHDFYGEWMPKMLSKTLTLNAAHQYSIKLECQSEPGGRSIAKLFWSSPSTSAQPIPQSLLYSPTNTFYGHLPDTDGDGIPDSWERAYGLDPNNPADAAQDPDGDGLTNLQEYQAGSDPWKADSNDDGIPDAWAVKYGLNAGGESVANEDADGDGLTNLQEYRLGTDPTKEDTDGDGLPDLVELIETHTDPANGDIQSIETAAEAPGNAAAARLGEWEVEGHAIHAVSRRGYVEYELKAPTADMYRLDIQGGMHDSQKGETKKPMAFGSVFPLVLSVDGSFLDRKTLPIQGSVHTLTPWLPAGPHRVRVFWDNASRFHSALEIASVKLVRLKGKDKDGNGVSDWVDARLKALSGLGVDASGVVESVVSPFCLEGYDKYVSTVTIKSGGTNLVVHPGARPGWYSDVPLQLRDLTTVNVSLENGGLRRQVAIKWVPLDLTKTNRITIRKGDTLSLSVGGNGKVANDFTTVSIVVPGVTNYTGTQPVPVRFDTAGIFTVTGQRSGDKTGASYQLLVTVVDCVFGDDTVAWVDKFREWSTPKAPEGVVLTPDAALSVIQTNGLTQIRTSEPSANYLTARLGSNGPILGTTRISGFDLFSAWETELYVIEEYEDGSQLAEMGIVMSPLLPDVTVTIRLVVGGVLFDDGNVEKTLTAADFNELGQAAVRFVRSAGVATAVCHVTTAHQGSVLLGIH